MIVVEVVAAVLGLYGVSVVLLALFQRAVIYQPGQVCAEPAELGLGRMVPVPLRAADGWVATGWYAPPDDPRAATIVFFHGNGGTLADRAHKARSFLEAGHGLFLVGYRGYGGNPGRPSELGLYADGRAALHWLTGRGLPAGRLVLYGESLGAAIAVQMAVEQPDIAALVLEAPFTRLAALAPPYLLPGLGELLIRDKFDTLAKIGRVAAPLLVVHGEADSVVPPAMGRALLAAADTVKDGVFLAGAGHDDVWEQGGDNAVMDFLARRVPR